MSGLQPLLVFAKCAFVQGGIGGSGPSQGMRASSVASGVRSPTPTPTAPHSGQEQLGYAEGMGQEGIRLDSGEGTTPQGAMQVLYYLR